jgi:hypothetical protein
VSVHQRREFAIRLSSIEDLFWEFDARPVAERTLSGDARFAMLDEWDRVRKGSPRQLVIYVPDSEREQTDEEGVRAAIRKSLHKASGPLRDVDPLSRQEKVAAGIGILVFFVTILASTVLDRVSDEVLIASLSQGILVVGWVALWAPADRAVVQVGPHLVNRRRFQEFADIEVRFAWV